MRLFPTQDRLIVKPVKAKEKTVGGIILPDGSRQDGVIRATVLEVGPGSANTLGRCPVRIDKGVDVFHTEYAGHEIDLDGEKVRVIAESDVLAVIGE